MGIEHNNTPSIKDLAIINFYAPEFLKMMHGLPLPQVTSILATCFCNTILHCGQNHKKISEFEKVFEEVKNSIIVNLKKEGWK